MTTITAIKRTSRAKKTDTETLIPTTEPTLTPSAKKEGIKTDEFTILVATIEKLQQEYEALCKEIAQTKESWKEEQQRYTRDLQEQRQQEVIIKKREQETYEYETTLSRKKDQDAFEQKKSTWERELADKKQELLAEKQELEALRKQVVTFEEEKEKAIKLASDLLEKTLKDQFATQIKLREQEIKSEKDLLQLRLTNQTNDNDRLIKEVLELKKNLDATTRELKDVAVRVIDASKPQSQVVKPVSEPQG